jgi:translation initiation factor IF-2
MKVTRPPVVAIMGHIDHGKSTLLDYIRKTNITEKEAGGITQHISAYEVVHKSEDGRESKITFLDTPGHEAFKGVRTKGAGAADIVILVVSAEDGVKPQTTEALNQIKESGTPFMIAITKIDKPSADINRTKQNMAENGIYVEGYGGDVTVVAVSAKSGEGVDELLDTILLMADLENFTGETDEPGRGIIIESRLDAKKGITATGIIKDGTVSKGMFAASAGTTVPLRFILNAEGKNVDELSFSSPVQIVGWDKLPSPGREFRTFLKKEEAAEYALKEEESTAAGVIKQKIGEGVSALPLVIKADTAGSLEAIKHELEKVGLERIVPQIVISGVGSISESDVKVALTTPNTIVIGFNNKVDSQAALLAERLGVQIIVSSIIYELTDKVAELLKAKEPRIEVEEVIGQAKILKIFSVTKDKQVIGGRVISGRIDKGASVRIIRREAEIGTGKIKELQQAKVPTNSVGEETEFGGLIESRIEIVPSDIIEAVIMVTK